ncbi:MAG: hypothetical protein JW952_04815 [Candidatus Eisenbacteria bacterium]|nr:hypothetical protein [Candidatus Eisenbacteria bacterium]
MKNKRFEMYKIYSASNLVRVLTCMRLAIAIDAAPVRITKTYMKMKKCCMRSPSA